MTLEQLVEILDHLYPSGTWPEPFNLLRAKGLLDGGTPLAQVAKDCGVTKPRVTAFLAEPDPVVGLLGPRDLDDKSVKNATQMLGNLIVGRCAERVFVEEYKREAATNELELSDEREGYSDTDYRLLNGKKRPVYRVNIKFVGSVFRRAKETVGLDPDDCFALATYKINAALEKQVAENLPFLFIVVSVPGLSAEDVGNKAPAALREFLALLKRPNGISKKRQIQDQAVSWLEESEDPGYMEVLDRIAHGSWYVLSARRADILMREKLFERVFALRLRGFAQNFRGAEVDMHFSFSRELTPLDTYLHKLRESGYPMVTTMLERGLY